MSTSLPEGRRGQALAAGFAILACATVWLALVSPLRSWYDERAETLERREALAVRMSALVSSIPALRDATAKRPSAEAPALLAGASDAIASATLLGKVQAMAAQAGAPLSSVEAMPAEALPGDAAYRRISLRIAFSAPWDAVVSLLQALEQANPRMLVDDLQLHALLNRAGGDATQLDASLTVTALRGSQAKP